MVATSSMTNSLFFVSSVFSWECTGSFLCVFGTYRVPSNLPNGWSSTDSRFTVMVIYQWSKQSFQPHHLGGVGHPPTIEFMGKMLYFSDVQVSCVPPLQCSVDHCVRDYTQPHTPVLDLENSLVIHSGLSLCYPSLTLIYTLSRQHSELVFLPDSDIWEQTVRTSTKLPCDTQPYPHPHTSDHVLHQQMYLVFRCFVVFSPCSWGR